jgi:hypothetical protein
MNLSAVQERALALLARGPFKYSVAGWTPIGGNAVAYFSTPTMNALASRGLAQTLPTMRRWLITKAGRKAARARLR